jgi:hypothetical protein
MEAVMTLDGEKPKAKRGFAAFSPGTSPGNRGSRRRQRAARETQFLSEPGTCRPRGPHRRSILIEP